MNSANAKPIGLLVVLLVAFIAARVLAEPAPQAKRDLPQAAAAAPTAAASAGAASRSTRPSRAAYVVEPVANGGTIRIVCKLSKAADVQTVPFNKDQGPGKCGHDSMKSERMLFDPATLGLQNCVVYLVDVAKGKDFEGELAEVDREVILDQKECHYVPHVMLLRPGSRVAIKNSDNVQHNAKCFRDTKAALQFNAMSSSMSMLSPVDDTTLGKAGNYILNCDIHLWMTGYIRAIPHPYFAISGPDGACTLTDVPAGTYRLACWHEGMRLAVETSGAEISGYRYSEDFLAPEQSVTVPAGGTVDAVFTIDPR